MIGVDLRITNPLFKNQWIDLIDSAQIKLKSFNVFKYEYNCPYQVSGILV